MNEQLQLGNIRNVLIRHEETIIFALIERAQFNRNPVVYDDTAFRHETDGRGILGYLLFETEKSHALLRRYTSPDEHPFCQNLPAPVLPALRFDENPLHAHRINYNKSILQAYTNQIIPLICRDGDDLQYGSTAVCDVAVLQALSKRIHYGMFVAESKYQSAQAQYDRLIADQNAEGIDQAITDAAVENQVLQRVERKVSTYCREISSGGTDPRVTPDQVVEVYRRFVIPMTKQVEVKYLLQRTS